MHGECRDTSDAYRACLRAHGQDAGACAALVRAYLACRMDRGLMERDAFANLGLDAAAEGSAPVAASSAPAAAAGSGGAGSAK